MSQAEYFEEQIRRCVIRAKGAAASHKPSEPHWKSARAWRTKALIAEKPTVTKKAPALPLFEVRT